MKILNQDVEQAMTLSAACRKLFNQNHYHIDSLRFIPFISSLLVFEELAT